MIYFDDLESFEDLFNLNFSCDIETTFLDKTQGEIYCVGFYCNKGGVVFFLNDDEDKTKLLSLLKKTLLNPRFKYEIYFHNVFFDLLYIVHILFAHEELNRTNLLCEKIYDTLILSRFLNTTAYQDHIDIYNRKPFSLKFLSSYYDIDKNQKSFDDTTNNLKLACVNTYDLARYCYVDCKNTFILFKVLKKESLSDDTWAYFEKFHSPHAFRNVLHMNLNGIPIDAFKLKQDIIFLEGVVEIVKDQVFDEVHEVFDFNSINDLVRVIFRSEFIRDNNGKALKKVYVTAKGNTQLDSIVLNILKTKCSTPLLIDKFIFVLECIKGIGAMERLLEKTVFVEGESYIYPNQSVSTSSARLKCTNPPVHGFGKKVFANSCTDYLNNLNPKLKHISLRKYLGVKDSYSVLSSDAKSMDLVMIAELAKITSWKVIFKSGVDNHFEILRLANPILFNEAFKDIIEVNNNMIVKLSEDAKGFFLKMKKEITSDVFRIDLTLEQFERISKYRAIAKELNLAIPYILGANQLALKLSYATDSNISEKYARGILETYYEHFPEIRILQDQVAQDIYDKGFVRAKENGKYFGIKLHSNTYNRMNLTLRNDNSFEFVVKVNGHHFYISTYGWIKDIDENKVTENLKYANNPYGFYFKEWKTIRRLPDNIFEQQLIKKEKGNNRHKNEDDVGDKSNYVYSAAERTFMINDYLDSNTSEILSSLESNVLNNLYREGYPFVLESSILFLRAVESCGKNYFKPFKSLKSEVRKIFPTYIQSVSSACVARTLSEVREEIENRGLKSYIYLSVHDSIDIMVHDDEKDILLDITEPSKLKDSFLPILWERDEFASSHS